MDGPSRSGSNARKFLADKKTVRAFHSRLRPIYRSNEEHSGLPCFTVIESVKNDAVAIIQC